MISNNLTCYTSTFLQRLEFMQQLSNSEQAKKLMLEAATQVLHLAQKQADDVAFVRAYRRLPEAVKHAFGYKQNHWYRSYATSATFLRTRASALSILLLTQAHDRGLTIQAQRLQAALQIVDLPDQANQDYLAAALGAALVSCSQNQAMVDWLNSHFCGNTRRNRLHLYGGVICQSCILPKAIELHDFTLRCHDLSYPITVSAHHLAKQPKTVGAAVIWHNLSAPTVDEQRMSANGSAARHGTDARKTLSQVKKHKGYGVVDNCLMNFYGSPTCRAQGWVVHDERLYLDGSLSTGKHVYWGKLDDWHEACQLYNNGKLDQVGQNVHSTSLDATLVFREGILTWVSFHGNKRTTSQGRDRVRWLLGVGDSAPRVLSRESEETGEICTQIMAQPIPHFARDSPDGIYETGYRSQAYAKIGRFVVIYCSGGKGSYGSQLWCYDADGRLVPIIATDRQRYSVELSPDAFLPATLVDNMKNEDETVLRKFGSSVDNDPELQWLKFTFLRLVAIDDNATSLAPLLLEYRLRLNARLSGLVRQEEVPQAVGRQYSMVRDPTQSLVADLFNALMLYPGPDEEVQLVRGLLSNFRSKQSLNEDDWVTLLTELPNYNVPGWVNDNHEGLELKSVLPDVARFSATLKQLRRDPLVKQCTAEGEVRRKNPGEIDQANQSILRRLLRMERF